MADRPLVERIEAAAYTIPTERPEADGTLTWSDTTLVTVTITAGGEAGWGWTYGPPACARLVHDQLTGGVVGSDALAIAEVHASLRAAVRNVGWPGVASYAVSAVDVALWDLKARLLGVPLHRLLGAGRDEVPVYGSGGFTSQTDAELREQVEGWLGHGVKAVKLKIGESWGAEPGRDLHRTELVRELIGSDRALFVDANGGYTRKQAVRIGRSLDALGVSWFEEPVSSDDKEGLALVRELVLADVTAGEYACDDYEFLRLAKVVDCLQVDASRCGGITGWQRAAAVAAAHGLQVSGHCAPHLHAAVAAATPQLRHLEWFADHVRIESRYVEGAGRLNDGLLALDPSCPGHGLTLRRSDLAQFRVA